MWAHRWEHDKNPELLFRALEELREVGCEFVVSVLGERGPRVPPVFGAATKEALATRILHWDYIESKEKFLGVLRDADVAISTARCAISRPSLVCRMSH